MLQCVTLLLVVFTPTYTPFGYSFACKKPLLSAGQKRFFTMISVPVGTGDIPCGYDICCADEIRFAYSGTDIISYLQSKYINRQRRISYRQRRYITMKKSHNVRRALFHIFAQCKKCRRKFTKCS